MNTLMATDPNVAIVDHFFDAVLNGTDPGAVHDLLSDDFLIHHSQLKNGQGGAADIAPLMTMFRTGFPDLHYDVKDHIAQNDRVAVRWVATGTNTGPYGKIPPTGVAVTVDGNDIFRIADGRIAEAWVCSDLLHLLQQLGVIPPA